MSGWLSAAGKAFQRRPKEPQRFELKCGCGTPVAGERTSSYQCLRCEGCDATLFVLPESVYPPPKQPKSKAQKQPAATRSPAADRLPGTDASTPGKRRTGTPDAAATSAGATVDAPSAGPASAMRDMRKLLLQAADRMLRRWVTLVRLVLVCVLLIGGFTAWWIVHSRALRHAESVFSSASKQGHEALQNKDLAGAAESFDAAARAADTLARDDAPAREVRQLARETVAAYHLSLRSLNEVLEDAAISAPSGEAAWAETFRISYKGGWAVIETTVSRVEGGPSPGFRLDYPIVSGQNRASLVANLPAFERLLADQPSRRVVFAAQLADCRRDPEAANSWLIELQPETAFLWSSADNFTSLLDVEAGDPTTQTLAEQTRFLGLAP